jgi:hypothetical protein
MLERTSCVTGSPPDHRPRFFVFLALVAVLAIAAAPVLARPIESPEVRSAFLPEREAPASIGTPARLETLWIFDADFEDLVGDNAGWTSEDRSGTLAIPNYWHKDTIRINGFEHLGDSTWWCGKYDPCWRQPRGYGNNWFQLLWRGFPEVATQTSVGDTLLLEYDQRYAMEKAYDYGYVDLRSAATGDTWYTLHSFCNPGFLGTPGIPQDWDSTYSESPGHMTLDLSDFAGEAIDVRFRFESDGAYSSQDQWDNPPFHSVLDGAWQIDNITLRGGSPVSVIFFDDCESPGDNGWVHDGIPAQGQAGVTFWRGLYGTDLWTNRPFSCDEQSGWMYAAVDPLTCRMVDNEYAWLVSPPIYIEGAEKLVGQWDMWVDLPRPTNDIFNIRLGSHDDQECWNWYDPGGGPGWWYGGPFWGSWTDDWDAFAGNAWLHILWEVQNDEPPDPGVEHMGGIFLNRQRVGIPTGDPGTAWSYSAWYRFNDWFQEQMAEALLDSATINVKDDDDIVSVTLVADNGVTQTNYTCRRDDPLGNDWTVPPPVMEMIPGAEIHYYYEALDGGGITSTFPSGAPDVQYEFSILPIHGSVDDPCVLLVDKHGRRVPGEHRDYSTMSEDYYREALDILGFEYDVYDVEVPSGSTDQSDGPDSEGYKYYDTQIWFASDFGAYTVKPIDQQNLIAWLSQSEEGKERNLLLTGNDIATELGAADSLGFLATWLATEYLDGAVGDATVDSVPGLRDFAGGFDFMTYDDRECVLRGGCPELCDFDVIQPYPGVDGAELVAEYVKADMTTRPAGVAHTDSTGYQTVILGFGVEFMSDVPLPTGYYASGASDRVDLIANIMEYFQKAPTGPGTGTEGNKVFATKLSHARPNPFNPATTIAYSLAGRSRVIIRVYDVAGRVVTTLVDGEVEAGPHAIVWNGTTDSGERAASGVYFVKMEGAGDAGVFGKVVKAVMLK